MSQKLLSAALYLLAALIGIVALAFPFISRELITQASAEQGSLGNIGPLLSTLLVSLCLVVLLVELQGQAAGAKTVAALGIMISATAILRFIEVGIPGPAGFSPIFVPIIFGGFVFGGRFGFLLGAMTLLVSAIITGGVGPWLPYQMFTAGWMGMTAGWLPHAGNAKTDIFVLAVFSFAWGFAYGLIMNLYTWPYLLGDPRMTYQIGEGAADAVRRYVAYYLTTSLIWDSAAAVGNILIVVALGLPTIRALTRFRGRMQFSVQHL